MDAPENKKVSLEDLSKEDLIKKCKNLITLAQKAKASKESLQEEVNSLKEQLNETHQKDATSEVLEKLTNEKLLLVSQIEDLKLKNKKFEEESNLSQEKINRLETENTSYARQVKRLTDENEQLLSDLSALEAQITELHKLGVEQKSQLLELEKSNGDSLRDLQSKLSVSLEEVQKLNNNLVNKEKEITELSQELQALKIIRNSASTDSNKNCDNYIKEINELKTKNESYSKELLDIQNTNVKLKDKLTQYHSKLKKFALITKEIKEEKNHVVKSFKAYTGQIAEWKEQLRIASCQLVKLVNQLENENKILKNEYEAKLKSLKDQELQDTISKHTLELEELNSALSLCKTEVDVLNKEIASKQKLLDETIESKEKVETENQQLKSTLQKCQEQLDYVGQELTVKNEALTDCMHKYEHASKSLADVKEEVHRLNEALKQSLDTEKRLADRSSEEILRLAQDNKDLEEKYMKSQDELNAIKNKAYIDSFVQTYEDIASQNSSDLKRDNSELLLEMNQMNQALKERGEIISKLEAHCEEIKKKLQLYETQANKNVDSITEKDETIKSLYRELDLLRNNDVNINTPITGNDENSKDAEIAKLKLEIEVLKEKHNNSVDTNYAESETMSTSTISRSEDINRLKDLEGSWEERYGKLRTLAVKLKAKIREQGATISQLEKEKEELQKKMSNALQTIKNLQIQNDNLHDDLDRIKADNQQYLIKLNSVAENISKDKQLLVENEETILKLKKEIDKLNDEKQGVENWKKQVSAKVQTLRKELEAKNLVLKDSENKISLLESELKNEQDSHKQTKDLLEQTSSECKKNSVLTLEMQDYERSVKELSQKIEKQKTEIDNLQTQLDMQKNTTSALREQNKILEERIQEEEKNGKSYSLELGSCKKTIANLEELLQQKEDKILDISKLLETTRSENEELSTELSKVIAEHQKSIGLVKSERDQLRNQLMGLQQNLRELQEQLKLKEDELGVVKDDYETYKVRAQSVLKKNQNRDLGFEERLSEELATVKGQNSKLENELGDFREKLVVEQNKNENLLQERDRLIKKCNELESEVDELKDYSEQLAMKHQKTVAEHAETVRNLKIQAETLSQCYRQQLSEQEVRHNREIIELQSRIDKAPSPVETLPVPPGMPREEGEGSESIESNPPPNPIHPVPLERLLDSKSDDEMVQLKRQLFEQESKVVHLTALLSDTEQDLAKHVQMNKVLKEEIRRQQRSVEREKHAENLEYLKNVVFKFVTLNNGDERTRLVPVLNTILKLSPEETQKLTMVAKGDPGIKGWASYLPMWSSPNKPQ